MSRRPHRPAGCYLTAVNLRPYLEFATQTAYEAGRLTLGYFGDWSGEETIYGNEAMSTTRTLLSEVLRLIERR